MSAYTVRSLLASDGYQLHFRHWPALSPRGIIVALHGIQSHSDWYRWSAAALCEAGYEVYFADRRGSGMNSVARGHADHGLRLINDVRQLMQLARFEHSATRHSSSLNPVHGPSMTVMGISWGGRIAAALAAEFPQEVDRLCLLYPGLEPRNRPNLWQNLQLRAARTFDVRHRRVRIPLDDPALFTSDREWQKYIRFDSLALHDVTVGFLNSGRDLDQIIHRHAALITHPTLLMLAGQDQIIDNEATRHRLADFQCRQQTTILYPEACHTLEFERDRDHYMSDLLDWLKRTD